MEKWRMTAFASGIAGAMALGVACQDLTAPRPMEPGDAAFHEGDAQPKPVNFRLTGGGRVDQRDHEGYAKHTPDSRDFATFGFQARPVGPNTTEGSGNFTWVEHDPNAPGGGFTLHGRVTYFSTPLDDMAEDGDCARFGGMARAQRRDGVVYDPIEFEVNHACDEGEPGVGRDHIRLTVPGYTRHGLLSGGNIQKHRLTGSGSR